MKSESDSNSDSKATNNNSQNSIQFKKCPTMQDYNSSHQIAEYIHSGQSPDIQ